MLGISHYGELSRKFPELFHGDIEVAKHTNCRFSPLKRGLLFFFSCFLDVELAGLQEFSWFSEDLGPYFFYIIGSLNWPSSAPVNLLPACPATMNYRGWEILVDGKSCPSGEMFQDYYVLHRENTHSTVVPFGKKK